MNILKNTKLVIIITFIALISIIIFIINQTGESEDTQTTSGVILVPQEVYTTLKDNQQIFKSLGITPSNNFDLVVSNSAIASLIIPKTLNVYSFQNITQKEITEIKNTITKTTGMTFKGDFATGPGQSAHINPDTYLISYSSGNASAKPFPNGFNDEFYLPQAKEAGKQMGFDLSNYTYTEYEYFKQSGYDLITVNKPLGAMSIKYLFERTIDGYPVFETNTNTKKVVKIWLNTEGKLLKLEGTPFGKIGTIDATLSTKTKTEIRESLTTGDFNIIWGDVSITGETIKSAKLNSAEIIYATHGKNAIPLVKLTGIAETTTGKKGTVYFVTDLIDLSNVKEINK